MTETGSIFKINGTDEVYCAIRDEINPRCQEAKIFVEELWGKAHKYLDSDILKELPVQFHQRFWEIYLAASLLESGLNLQHSSGRDGPDICIKANDGSKIWVEAVTASPGQGNDAVQEAEIGTVRSVPDDQIKLRLLNAFAEKSRKHKRYREKNWVSPEEPYIIAINAAQVPSARRELEIPRIVRSLLLFGFQVLHLSRETSEVTGTSYEYQGEVIKASGTEIETTSFLNPEYSGISAVIYSCVDAFNYPTEISKSLLLFHNPLATAPLLLGFLKKGYEYWVDEHLKNKNWNQDIVGVLPDS
jgi:hypothetical protein